MKIFKEAKILALAIGLISVNINFTLAQDLSLISKTQFNPFTLNRFVNLSKQLNRENFQIVSSNYNSTVMLYQDIHALNVTSSKISSFTEAKKYVLANAPKLNQIISVQYSKNDLDETEGTGKNESFFTEELLYFVGAAALATTFYLVWSDNDSAVNKKTFGQPPKP